uniref:L-threonylcarbamoyladenylate synthase n=1 Tax=Candidatus Methanophagaceae archaeon ANME-1 ERB6 TaxID=2759912 RepID=A0A7G9YTG4_9EURY|nr:threonylcarbamoyl-AMP synthase [Methanosarcinales archaeon ANME-1 ERB6]
MQNDIEDQIKTATAIIKNGGMVVYPTETVYGLGADAFSEAAVRNVYKIKRRAVTQPISIAVSSFEMLHEVADIDSECFEIIAELLPGPVTILLRKKDVVPAILTAASEVVGVRFPDNEIATRIIKETGPITATSANVSGRNPPTCIEEVEIELKLKVELGIIINGGKCKYSMPSTVVDMSKATANEKGEIEIKRKGACYDRVLHVLRSKAVGEGLHRFSVP